jgi:hypothetical protein
MQIRNFGRIAVAALVIAATLAPNAVAAQSDGDPNATVVDDTPVDDSGAVEVIEIPPPVPPVGEAPSYQANMLYLGRLQGIRAGWANARATLNNIARQQRLGTLPPEVIGAAVKSFPGTVDTIEQLLTGITPPPQFAHVHQLHLSAAAEFRAGMEAAERVLAGDQASLSAAQSHFARFDDFIGQALQELG